MIRGGGWPEAATLQTSEFRGSTDVPTSFWKNVGIRCARPPG
jgi:formylglycine-generating enzyme required for sulfatase activity